MNLAPRHVLHGKASIYVHRVFTIMINRRATLYFIGSCNTIITKQLQFYSKQSVHLFHQIKFHILLLQPCTFSFISAFLRTEKDMTRIKSLRPSY